MSVVETATPINSSPCAWVSRGPLPEFLWLDTTETVNPDNEDNWWSTVTARGIPIVIDGMTVTPDEVSVRQERCVDTNAPILVWLEPDSDLERWCDVGVDDVLFEDAPHLETWNRVRLACSRVRRRQSVSASDATKDPLTGLPNRSALDSDHVRLRLCGASSCGFVVFIDLNGFKGINDTLGHACGDQVLVEMAHRFRTTVRGRDLIVRWGGDEFLIVLPGASKPQAVNAFLSRVRAIAEAPLHLKGREVSLSASCGSACWGGEVSFREAIEVADDSMYRAKRHKLLDLDLSEQSANDPKLSYSFLEGGQIRVAMQPVFDIHSLRVLSYEAFMRFQDSRGQSHSAIKVLPSAEQAGMLDAMESCVWRQACLALSGLSTSELPMPTVSLNVYPTTIMRQGFVAELLRTCEANGIAPHQVIAEFSEDRLIAGWTTCFPFIQQMVEHGFGIGLDDCAMEMPLSRLMAFPFRHIKVRADVVRRAWLHDTAAERVMRAVAKIGPTLPLSAIVTRIETKEDIHIAKTFNLRQGQGFYFGPSVISLPRAETYSASGPMLA